MLIKIIFAVGRAQVLGVIAQLVSALPLLLVSVVVARRVGLEALVDLTALIGFSAIISTIALLGLRTRLILEQLQTISFGGYCTLRVCMALVTVVTILVFGIVHQADLALVLMLAFLRVGDILLDLVLAVDQIRLPTTQQLYAYLAGSMAKLSATATAIVAVLLLELSDPYPVLLAAATVYAVYAAKLLRVRWRGESQLAGAKGWRVRKLIFLVRSSLVFMIAQVLCSLLTSYPRLALGSGDKSITAGVAGAALTAATLAGMVYYAVWLRWASRLGKGGLKRSSIVPFFVELALVSVIGAAIAATVGAQVTAAIYGIDGLKHLQLIQQILLWSVVFFSVMTIANLFKPSTVPWAESMTYVAGLAAAAGLHRANANVPTWELLAAASYGMLAVETAFLVVFLLRRKGSVSGSC